MSSTALVWVKCVTGTNEAAAGCSRYAHTTHQNYISFAFTGGLFLALTLEPTRVKRDLDVSKETYTCLDPRPYTARSSVSWNTSFVALTPRTGH